MKTAALLYEGDCKSIGITNGDLDMIWNIRNPY